MSSRLKIEPQVHSKPASQQLSFVPCRSPVPSLGKDKTRHIQMQIHSPLYSYIQLPGCLQGGMCVRVQWVPLPL